MAQSILKMRGRCAVPETQAERDLLEAAVKGKAVVVKGAPAPDEKNGWTDDHTIRAVFLRHVLLHPKRYAVDPRGIKIKRARIEGRLDLTSATIDHPLAFTSVRFEARPDFCDATVHKLEFWSCFLPDGLTAERISVGRLLTIRNCTIERVVNEKNSDKSAVNLINARIGGNLTLSGSTINNPAGEAIQAGSITVAGEVFACGLTARGSVEFIGASIRGDLDCRKATFNNPQNKSHMKAGALMVNGTTIGGRLILTEFKQPPIGHILLRGCTIGELRFDKKSWPKNTPGAPPPWNVDLHGCTYDRIGSHAKVRELEALLALLPDTWDENGAPEVVFYPQPYEQLIKVLRQTGHDGTAREIAILKQNALRRYLKRQSQHQTDFSHCLRRFALWFLWWSAGYGYRSYLAFLYSVVLILLGSIAFTQAYLDKQLLPAKELAYIHKCATLKPTSQTNVDLYEECDWYFKPIRLDTASLFGPHFWGTVTRPLQPDPPHELRVPKDYVPFQPIAYSIDVFVPILDLHQETNWMPKDGWWRFYMWLHIGLGWLFSTIWVAGLSGLIKKD